MSKKRIILTSKNGMKFSVHSNDVVKCSGHKAVMLPTGKTVEVK